MSTSSFVKAAGWIALAGVTVVVVIVAVRRPREPPPATHIAEVVHVVDGDTIDVRFGGVTERVRLLGVDTPETVDERRPVQCYGPEASAYTHALLPPGTRVRVVRDVEARDRYGRLLGYVFRSDDGVFVNRALLDGGFATTLSIEPNVAYRGEFATARADAERRRVGLWGACAGFGVPQ